MIFDELNNADLYIGISPNLDKALMLIKDIDQVSLLPGRNEIDGNNVFVMVFDYETIEALDGCYESHQKYIDIQLVLSGSELIRGIPDTKPEVTAAYNKEGDAQLYELTEGVDLRLIPGRFALFLPGELHAPKLNDSTSTKVRKVVVKVLSK